MWIHNHLWTQDSFYLRKHKKVNPRNAAGFLRGAFSLEKMIRNVGAVDRITCKFTITLNPRRVLLEKTEGIWKGCCDACFPWKKIRKSGAVGRITYKFTVTLNARRTLPEKTQGIWGVGTTRIFLEKHKELAGVGHAWHIKLQSKWSPGAICMLYTTVSPRSVADWGGGVY